MSSEVYASSCGLLSLLTSDVIGDKHRLVDFRVQRHPKRQSHRDRKWLPRIVGRRRLWELTAKRRGISFGGVEDVLKIRLWGRLHNMVNVVKNHRIASFETMHSMIDGLHLNTHPTHTSQSLSYSTSLEQFLACFLS